METRSEATGGESRSGLCGHIELSVFSITFKVDAIMPKDTAKR